MSRIINWEEYAMELALTASKKSKDPYIQVGACLLRHDNSIASLGFNGFISGMKEDWSNRDERRKYVVHAEQNALRFVRPGECYLAASTLLPCNDCLKSLASYHIRKVIYRDIYEYDKSTMELAEKFGIELKQYEI